MERHSWLLLFVLALSIAAVACQKIEAPVTGQLEISQFELVDTIPAEFGTLVAVSSYGEQWTQLAFERDDGAVVLVSLNRERRFIADDVIVIPRS